MGRQVSGHARPPPDVVIWCEASRLMRLPAIKSNSNLLASSGIYLRRAQDTAELLSLLPGHRF